MTMDELSEIVDRHARPGGEREDGCQCRTDPDREVVGSLDDADFLCEEAKHAIVVRGEVRPVVGSDTSE